MQTLTCNYIYRSVTYISWTSDFAFYLEDYLMDKCHNWNIRSLWCKDLPHKMYVGQRPTFHGQVFCLMSWRLFGEGILYWRYWFSATLSLTYKYICRSVTYILWYSDSALYIQYYLMNKPHSSVIWVTCISSFSNFESFTHFCLQWFVEVWYENICECKKVRNRPVVYSRCKVGASMYFGHISISSCTAVLILKSQRLKFSQTKNFSQINKFFVTCDRHIYLKATWPYIATSGKMAPDYLRVLVQSSGWFGRKSLPKLTDVSLFWAEGEVKMHKTYWEIHNLD